jgi:hypothetical protein
MPRLDFHMTRAAVLVFVILSGAEVCLAQPAPVSNVDVLLGTHAILHVADVITTSYDLTRGRPFGAGESNPLLKPFGPNPVPITAASSALSGLEAVMIKRLELRHPKLATAWSVGLVAIEVWATINNVNRAGEIQRRIAGRD